MGRRFKAAQEAAKKSQRSKKDRAEGNRTLSWQAHDIFVRLQKGNSEEDQPERNNDLKFAERFDHLDF